MKQKTRTLPEAIKLFPSNWKKVVFTSIPSNFYSLPYKEKIKFNASNGNCTYYCTLNDKRLFFGKKFTIPVRSGKTFYPVNNWVDVICIEGRKITTSNLSIDGLKEFFSLIDIDFSQLCESIPNSVRNFLLKPSVIADILRKKVYSEETFYRCVSTKIFNLKNFNWRLFAKYIYCPNYISIPDLRDFTKDVAKSMEVLIHVPYDSIYNDLIVCASQLDEIVDLTWSLKRMKEEHARQIKDLQFIEIAGKDNAPVYNTIIEQPNVRMLNTEKDVFLEGKLMHHCIYSCYWQSIKNHNYVAFHMTFPEDCTFSFKLVNNQVVLDQAFLAYDQSISDITKACIDEFKRKHLDELKQMFVEKVMHADALDLPW